ncbi:MAG: LemA family protein [Peptoniphilaceae bacterium]|nr:LemA family protein [Peptoniphilaceae bacterium]MDD7383663.1 LemA family protein [Peptoniphilaceae bacterium]MDY3737834.1 LemA family protein [Peptoniphilaceae bacterium]
MKKVFTTILIAVIALSVIFIPSYNSLVTQKEEVNGQWAQVENQLKRRSDLIPNIVNTVKGYANHENKTFTELAKARSGIEDAKTIEEYEDANKDMDKALANLNVVVEAYPELKADKSFENLQVNLEGTENRISTERMRYNELVKKYNTNVKKFPKNIIATILGFSSMNYFQIDKADSEVPSVSF